MISGQAHQLEQAHDFFVVVTAHTLHHERFGNRCTHGHLWIKRGVRVLKYDLHSSTNYTQLFKTQLGKIHSLKHHLTCGGFNQPQDTPTHCGLS